MQILQTIWTALTTENDLILGIISVPFCFIEIYISMLLFISLLKFETTHKHNNQ